MSDSNQGDGSPVTVAGNSAHAGTVPAPAAELADEQKRMAMRVP